jgi:AmmeMemoRadiSam system protein A
VKPSGVLTREDQQKLLRWARQAIERAVQGESEMEVAQAELSEGLRAPYAAFVTIKKHGDLRGCIGKMDFERPVWENVQTAAVASAQEDQRFLPLQPDELAEVRLEISVLEPPQELARPELFDVQRHGIIVEKGMCHALLLPKVAQEYGWGAEKTLETVCVKAGLPPTAWRDADARLQVFEAFDFSEPEDGAESGKN